MSGAPSPWIAVQTCEDRVRVGLVCHWLRPDQFHRVVFGSTPKCLKALL
jgi:hypothetical protein